MNERSSHCKETYIVQSKNMKDTPRSAPLYTEGSSSADLHFTRTPVMMTLSNQTEIWCEASYDQNLMPNEILAHFDD